MDSDEDYGCLFRELLMAWANYSMFEPCTLWVTQSFSERIMTD